MTPDANDLCVFAVKWGKIEKRIDVSYNHPKYEKVIAALRSKVGLISFGSLIESISGGATPLRANEEQYCDSGIRFLRIQNISSNGFDLSDVKYITKDVHCNLLQRSQLSVGDLLMTITGRIGTSAVVSEDILPANINQHIVRIKLKDGVLPEFAAAYLNSNIGILLSNRGVTGTTRIALDYESIKNIPFPDIQEESNQKRLTRIVSRGTNANRANILLATDVLSVFERTVASDIGLLSNWKQKLCVAIHNKDIDGVIDAKRYMSIKKKSDGCLADICEILSEKVSASKFQRSIVDWIRIDDLPNRPLDIETMRTLPANEMEGSFFEVKKKDILVARLGPTILNKKTVMVRSIERTTLASAEFLVLRCKEGVNPEAVMAVLKTDYYRDLMYSHSRGSTPSRYRLNREDALKLPFPNITGTQDQIAKEALHVRDEVKRLREEAVKEWEEAKAQFEKELLGE